MLVLIVLVLVLLAFFLLWLFWGGRSHDFVGLGFLSEPKTEICPAPPLDPPSKLPPSFDLAQEAEAARRERRSLGERLTCLSLESYYGRPFSKVRLLRNPETGRLMEIDCYNSDLRIGAEYNGEQH